MMDLSEYRTKIDEIDRQLVALFTERMATAADIAAYKKAHHLPVLDAARERQKLRQIAELAPAALQNETQTLYRLLFALSRSYQSRLLGPVSPLPAEIEKPFPTRRRFSPHARPLPVRAWRAPTLSSRASVCSAQRRFPVSRIWTRFLPL